MTPPKLGSVLVVDDDPTLLVALAQVLRDGGYDVEAVADGESALQFVTRRAFDLVLLDVVMPGMDGWAVVDRMYTLLPLPPPIVLVTGHGGDQRDAHPVFRAAVAAVITKPLRIDDLLAICAQVRARATEQRALPLEDRRAHPRRDLIIEAGLLSEGGAPIALGWVTNLSRSGAEFRIRFQLNAGDHVQLMLSLAGKDDVVTCKAIVRRFHRDGADLIYGLEFTPGQPLEWLSALL